VGFRVHRTLSSRSRLRRRRAERGGGARPCRRRSRHGPHHELLIRNSDTFFGYKPPTDYRLEERFPELFPTNVRPETLAQDAALKQQAAEGKIPPAQFCASPRGADPYPRTTWSTLAGTPRPPTRIQPAQAGHRGHAAVERRRLQPQLAVHHLQQDGHLGPAAFQALPRHRRPVELERSDFAVSANIGRTLSACRQAVVDIRCCLDWLEEQGYEHFGVLGTSLGSCYAFLASAHDRRLRVNAFNTRPQLLETWSGPGRAPAT